MNRNKSLTFLVSLVSLLAMNRFTPSLSYAQNFCQCTEYVRRRDFGKGRIGIRSAHEADPKLSEHGFRRLSGPENGAIVVFAPTFPGAHRIHGHIGYIENIRSDGSLDVKGANQGNRNNFSDAGCNNVNITHFKTSVNGRGDVSFWKR